MSVTLSEVDSEVVSGRVEIVPILMIRISKWRLLPKDVILRLHLLRECEMRYRGHDSLQNLAKFDHVVNMKSDIIPNFVRYGVEFKLIIFTKWQITPTACDVISGKIEMSVEMNQHTNFVILRLRPRTHLDRAL